MRSSVIASVVGKSTEMVTLALLAVVVPRVLGAEDYGAFAVPLTVVTLGSLALTLGGPTVMTRYVPAAAPDQRLAVAKAIGARLARGRAVQLGVVALVTAGLVMARPATFPPRTTSLVVIALALNVAATLALQVGLGMGRAGAWSARYPLHNAALVAMVLVLHGQGRIGGVVAILVAGAITAAFAFVVTVPLLRTPTPPVALPVGAVRFGAYQAVGAALVQTFHRGGVLAVAVLVGSRIESGHTALATGITLGITYAVLQTFTVSLPHVVETAPDGTPADPEAAEEVLRRLATGLVLVLVAATAVTAPLLDELVPRVFGTDYLGAVDAFGPALALVALAPVSSYLTQVASLRLRPDVPALAGAVGAGVFLVFAVVAVPAWEAAGATAAALAAGIASAGTALVALRGAVGARLAQLSFGGAALTLALAVWT